MVCKSALPSAISLDQMVFEVNRDETLNQVKNFINGNKHGEIGGYKNIKNELSISSNGLVLRGNRICIPDKLKQSIIDIAHQGHQGIVRTKQLIRNFVWFPNIDVEVENTIKKCRECQINIDSTKLQPFKMSRMPNGPWDELSIDFYGPLANGKYLLVVVDDFSRYPVVKIINSTSHKAVVPILLDVLSTFGVPSSIRSDNGPPFNSKQFKEFANQQGFAHRRITPLWPRANGICERFMRNLGKVLRNSKSNNETIDGELINFLRNYRATPHASTDVAPNHLMFKTISSTSRLPVIRNKQDQCGDQAKYAQMRDQIAKQKMKMHADNKNKTSEVKFIIGDLVLLKQSKTHKDSTTYDPKPFTVVKTYGNQVVIRRDNQIFKRNSSMLKKFIATTAGENKSSTTSITVTILDPPNNPGTEQLNEDLCRSVTPSKSMTEPSTPGISEVSETGSTKDDEQFDDAHDLLNEDFEQIKALGESESVTAKTTKEKLQMLYESSLDESKLTSKRTRTSTQRYGHVVSSDQRKKHKSKQKNNSS